MQDLMEGRQMTLTEQERHDIERANEPGWQPVLPVHGRWLLSSSWDPWRILIEENGVVAVTPGWPKDPETVTQGRDNPDVFAHKMIGAVPDHYAKAPSRCSAQSQTGADRALVRGAHRAGT